MTDEKKNEPCARIGNLMEWIDINQALPLPYDTVLTYGDPVRGGLAWTICIYAGANIWRVSLSDAEHKPLISHWMPLPAPPQGKQNG